MWDPEEVLEFKIFCQEITRNPRRMDQQPHTREGIFLFCEDWEIIELCKYFFNGHDGYFGDPPPNRLKLNPLWSRKQIAMQAEILIQNFKTAPAIIEHLKKRREDNDG